MTDSNCEQLAHLYRGLVQTTSVWRQRLDVTETWSVPLLVALFTVAFDNTEFPHAHVPEYSPRLLGL